MLVQNTIWGSHKSFWISCSEILIYKDIGHQINWRKHDLLCYSFLVVVWGSVWKYCSTEWCSNISYDCAASVLSAVNCFPKKFHLRCSTVFWMHICSSWISDKKKTGVIYLLKVDSRNTRTRCEICSKLTIMTPVKKQLPYETTSKNKY